MPVSMMFPPKVKRPTNAAQCRGSVKVSRGVVLSVRREAGSLASAGADAHTGRRGLNNPANLVRSQH